MLKKNLIPLISVLMEAIWRIKLVHDLKMDDNN